jgi:hypothetical protein
MSRRRRVAAALEAYRPPDAPRGRLSWEAYTGDGRCECRQPATQALVRLHPMGTFATSIVRLACGAHRR